MFKFSRLLHKSKAIAVDVNNKTRDVSSLYLKSKKHFFSRKIRQACHKTKRIKRNEKDKDVMMHDSQQFINLLEEIQVVSFIAYFENTARALIKQDHLS